MTVRARFAILALAPILYTRISFVPAAAAPAAPDAPAHLDGLRHQGARRLRQAVLARAGLSGTAFSPYELSHEAYDNTNHGDERGTLVGFVSDRNADDVFRLSAEERKERILESLSHYYGPEAKNPIVYYESDWGTEEWTRGAYAASFDLGGLHRYGADLREPGRPHPLRLQRHRRRRLPARRRRDPHGAARRGAHHRGGTRMSGRIVVGYTATEAGEDAVALGARLAAASGSALDLVVVLPADDRSVITPPDASYDRYLQDQAASVAAMRRRPAFPTPSSTRTCASPTRSPRGSSQPPTSSAPRTSSSEPPTADSAAAIASGTVATELLHSSDVPVVLAPEGSRRGRPGDRRHAHHRGDRHPAGGRRAARGGHLARRGDRCRASAALARHGRSARRASTPASSASPVPPTPTRCSPRPRSPRRASATPKSSSAEATASKTRSQHLSWEPGELALVGSSRLAQPRRLFLGSTAAKMLHELPVPMIVVPRTRAAEGVSR